MATSLHDPRSISIPPSTGQGSTANHNSRSSLLKRCRRQPALISSAGFRKFVRVAIQPQVERSLPWPAAPGLKPKSALIIVATKLKETG